jgi:cytochrome P450
VEAMDPQRFECPEEWRPHRFLLNDDSHLISKFTPFSHGLHKCPGQKVSMTMMRLAIRSFLSLCKPSPSEVRSWTCTCWGSQLNDEIFYFRFPFLASSSVDFRWQ